MLTDYQIFAIGQIWPVLFVPLVVSAVYWFSANNISIGKRLLVAVPGMLLLVAFGYAVAVSPGTGHGNWQKWIWPFWILLGFSLMATVYTFAGFKGNRWVHLTQLLLLPSGFLIWLVGTMTITHDWL